MNIEQQLPEAGQNRAASSSQNSGWRTFGIVVITIAVTLGAAYWFVTAYLFPESFTPVVLDQHEQQVLEHKIQRITGAPVANSQQSLEPEAYTEAAASREIHFSEKELNALLASSTDLASKLVIDLSDNLASAKLLVDLDPDFPFIGGKTLKVTAGMEISLINGKPGAILKGVSVWGVPLPNAWLGNMKNADLSKEFGQSGGFWQALNEGIDEIEVKQGELRIKLKE